MIEGEVVNINSADNSVQVRVHGYQDDRGNIPDSGLQWVKTLGQHAGLQGATATHPYYVGSKVMLGMSGSSMFVMGSVTGYDSDKSKDKTGADDSENQDPNTPRQVRGTKGPYNRSIEAGEGSDQTSKGTRSVTKTDKPFDTEQPQKIFDYVKQIAPFDKGTQAKFPDLKSIGVDKLKQGSNVLDTIDQMDNNVSGAIKAGTKIIRNMEQGGFGDAMSLLNGGGGGGGGSADQGTAEVAQYHGNIQLGELLSALLALLAAYNLMQLASSTSMTSDLISVPPSLQYSTFVVDSAILLAIQNEVTALDASQGVAKDALILQLKSDFFHGFNQAVANAIAYVAQVVAQAGTAAILIQGTSSFDDLSQLIGSLQALASAAGMNTTAVSSIGGGQVGQIMQQGQSAVQQIMQQGQAALQQIQQMAQMMNTFAPEMNAMSEIMGGGASIQESLTNITMKFSKKRVNLDARGFTK